MISWGLAWAAVNLAAPKLLVFIAITGIFDVIIMVNIFSSLARISAEIFGNKRQVNKSTDPED